MSTPRPLRDAALALSLLTVVPTKTRWPEGERASVAGWFPGVGLLIGAVTWASVAYLPLQYLDSRALVIAAIVVTAQALTTRYLHLDGLADVADAYWGGHTPRRRLEIMKDSATGAFGAAAIVVALLLQAVAVAELFESRALFVLVAAPAVGRAAAMFAAWFGVPAREDGLGRTVMGRPGGWSVVAAVTAMSASAAAGWFGAGVAGVAFLAAGVLVALLVPHLLAGRIGGVTGDVMGASVVITETVLYVAAALMTGVIGS